MASQAVKQALDEALGQPKGYYATFATTRGGYVTGFWKYPQAMTPPPLEHILEMCREMKAHLGIKGDLFPLMFIESFQSNPDSSPSSRSPREAEGGEPTVNSVIRFDNSGDSA